MDSRGQDQRPSPLAKNLYRKEARTKRRAGTKVPADSAPGVASLLPLAFSCAVNLREAACSHPEKALETEETEHRRPASHATTHHPWWRDVLSPRGVWAQASPRPTGQRSLPAHFSFRGRWRAWISSLHGPRARQIHGVSSQESDRKRERKEVRRRPSPTASSLAEEAWHVRRRPDY